MSDSDIPIAIFTQTNHIAVSDATLSSAIRLIVEPLVNQ